MNFPKKKQFGSVSKNVSFVLEGIVDIICEANETQTENRRGRAKRKSYTNAFKYSVIEGMSNVEVAEQYGINKSLVAKWKQSRDAIETAAVEKHKNVPVNKTQRSVSKVA